MRGRLAGKLIVSIFFSVVIVLGYLLLFTDVGKYSEQDLIRVQQQIRELETKIEELRSMDGSDELNAHIRTLRQEILQATYSFPKDIGGSILLRKLTEVGDISGARVLLFEPQEAINEGVYEEIPIKLRLRGSYKQIASFLYGMSKMDLIVRVQDMKIIGPINSSSGVVMTESELMIATYRILGRQ